MEKYKLSSAFFIKSLVLLLFAINFTLNAQSISYWNDIPLSDIQTSKERIIKPEKFRTLTLNIPEIIKIFQTAPLERDVRAKDSKVIVSLPMPDGNFCRFSIVESPVMEKELADKYPEIKTYSGQGIDDPYATVRFDLTPQGFHAMIFVVSDVIFIDPYAKGDDFYYISYYKKDFRPGYKSFECEVIDNADKKENNNPEKLEVLVQGQLRIYHVAIAATGEYTIFNGGTVALGLAAVVTSLNRVDGVYEKEVSVRMVLVANNNLIIYTNASTDPYTNNNGSTMLGQNITNLNSIIGSANYDIGHVFSTGGGGVAYLGCVCTSTKAGGVTGSPAPIGDPFDIDYVAHEMGHQFGGNHTFNSITGSCGGGNRAASAAYEPGSGTTIMAYAGICWADDIQPHSDAYFHTKSLDEINAYTSSGNGNSCATITTTGNHNPVVTVPSGGFTIPISTPFKLTGTATDADNDPLTYCWEEFDLGNAGAPNSPSGNAPIFRSFSPVNTGTRIFPKVSDLVNNTQTIGEILPTYTRALSFRLISRDNRAGGGGTGYSNISFNVTSTAGPFVVTSPNTAVTWNYSYSQTITWNVANTSASPVSCSNVNILLSTDGGLTFPLTVINNTPNDGSEIVTLPKIETITARIKVEAVNNIFYDISNVNFSMTKPFPVELSSFTANVISRDVKLNWTTASEINNAGFEIQKSTQKDNWVKVGYVTGNGTITTPTNYSFEDKKLNTGKYNYRLKQIDYNGNFEYHNLASIVEVGVPNKFDISQNYPNPFNPTAKIDFDLPSDSKVSIKLYDIRGKEVMTLLNEQKTAGYFTVQMNGSNLSSGMYFYRIIAEGSGQKFVMIKKAMLIK